ncbi:hypothetical protein Scep_023176 [Stephania cephalantha]|uniref:Outer envelope protein 61 n=1 Tax=Stephania cephalantha TaxID=152367 RepID=A0AAP0EV29_9MAGN
MFNGMMDPELMRIAQEQMSKIPPSELARMQQQMMSNPELIRMASESMKNMKPEDLRNAAQHLKNVSGEDMAEISKNMANATPEEIASFSAQADAQVNYALSAAQMLKNQGNELFSKGKFSDATEKYLRAKENLKAMPFSKGRSLKLACSLNLMACYLKMKQYDDCVMEGTEALKYDAGNVKALYRRGQAHQELGNLEDAVSDLSSAHAVAPDDETISAVLRDAEEELSKGGGKRSVVIEEIAEEEVKRLPHENNASSSSSEYSVKKPQGAGKHYEWQPESSDGNPTIGLQSLQDPESVRSFQNFISNADPSALAALSGENAGMSPDMIKSASNMISKMPPEELQKMIQMASAFEGKNPFFPTGPATADNQSKKSGMLPQDVSPEMLKNASDMMSKMSPEDRQRMFKISSSLKGQDSAFLPTGQATANNQSKKSGMLPQDLSPEMLNNASDMMSKMSAEDRRRMFEIASSLRGQDSGVRSNIGSESSDVREVSASRRTSELGESSSSSNGFSNSRSASSQPTNFMNPSNDLQEQMRNQMKDPAMRQMYASMMKNISPDMMASMSEQFGMKLSREDAAKAQQAMSSLSPDDLDRMMRWADKLQSFAEGAKKTKNWLLGRPGLILAICMLILAMFLHRLGFIGS